VLSVFRPLWRFVFVSALSLCSAAQVSAADISSNGLPAVSAGNGFLEFGAGFADVDPLERDALYYGQGSIASPLGEDFGIQADLGAKSVFYNMAVGGMLHLFERNPDNHLIGAIAGIADLGDATSLFAGGEAEFYVGDFSLEAAAGVMRLKPQGTKTSTEFFGIADAVYYPTENLRLTLGGSSVAGFESARLSAEYLMEDQPLSFKIEGAMGEDDFVSLKAGITLYFGGNDVTKNLKKRNREDHVRNRFLDLSNVQLDTTPTCPPLFYLSNGVCIPQPI
jgi:hypothetical protein